MARSRGTGPRTPLRRRTGPPPGRRRRGRTIPLRCCRKSSCRRNARYRPAPAQAAMGPAGAAGSLARGGGKGADAPFGRARRGGRWAALAPGPCSRRAWPAVRGGPRLGWPSGRLFGLAASRLLLAARQGPLLRHRAAAPCSRVQRPASARQRRGVPRTALRRVGVDLRGAVPRAARAPESAAQQQGAAERVWRRERVGHQRHRRCARPLEGGEHSASCTRGVSRAPAAFSSSAAVRHWCRVSVASRARGSAATATSLSRGSVGLPASSAACA